MPLYGPFDFVPKDSSPVETILEAYVNEDLAWAEDANQQSREERKCEEADLIQEAVSAKLQAECDARELADWAQEETLTIVLELAKAKLQNEEYEREAYEREAYERKVYEREEAARFAHTQNQTEWDLRGHDIMYHDADS